MGAEVARRGEKLGRCRQNAALALHRFDDERRRAVVDRGRKRVDVVEGREREAARQRSEAFFVRGVVGGGQRTERAAVKRVVGGEDRRALGLPLAPGMLARELDRAFVRLGAGIAEEHRVEAGEFGQTIGQRAGRFVMVEVAAVHERRGLIGDRRA